MQSMELEIGAILEGKVTGITSFGAFVSLPGGQSGLVHISEVAYAYVSDVNEFLTVGQDVKVKVISVNENKRINLSIKQTLPPPPKPERTGSRGGFNGNNNNRRNGYHSNRDRNDYHERDNRGGDKQPDNGERRQERPYNNRDNRSRSNNPRNNAPKEPLSFEDMMKQYMSESETKLSQLNRGERSRRRSRRG